MDSKGYQQSKYTRGLERADPRVGSSPSHCAPGLLPIDGWSSSSSFSCFTPCFYPCFSPFPLVFSLLCTSPSSWCVCPSPSLCCSYQLQWDVGDTTGLPVCMCVLGGGVLVSPPPAQIHLITYFIIPPSRVEDPEIF